LVSGAANGHGFAGMVCIELGCARELANSVIWSNLSTWRDNGGNGVSRLFGLVGHTAEAEEGKKG